MTRKLIPIPQRPPFSSWRSRSVPMNYTQPEIRLEAGALTIPLLKEFGGWDGITYDDFAKDMERFENADYDGIKLEIHSGGGDVFIGLGIYNMLAQMDADITAEIPGLAASAATVVAMAADTVRIGRSARFMIHRSWSFSMGDAEEMRRTADMLDAIDEDIAMLYDERTELGRERIMSMMEEETWMNGSEALEMGFADELMRARNRQEQNRTSKGRAARAGLNAWLQRHSIHAKESRK